MAGFYMLLRTFAREVDDLEPPWSSTKSNFARILRRMDEAGALKPTYRLHFPEDFAKYHWKYPQIDEDTFSPHQLDRFSAIEDALVEYWTPYTDSLREQFESEDSVLAAYLREPEEEETVRWSEWLLPVEETEDGRTITSPHVFSVYSAWQTIQCWFVMEKFSFHALLDPTQMHPREVYEPSRELIVGDDLLKCTTGNGRALQAFEETNASGWIERLYRFREDIREGQRRVRDPHGAGWEEGLGLSDKERREAVDDLMRERARTLGAAWVDDREDFCSRITGLLEMVAHAEGLYSPELVEILHRDLWTAIDWSYYLYGKGLNELDELVHPAGPFRRKSLYSELRPTWHEARRSAEFYLEQFVHDDDDLHPKLSLSEESLENFLDFLFTEGLESWVLELSQVQEEFAHPTDASLDRRFLHLRSMAILTETVIGRLAEKFGSSSDRAGARDWKLQSTYRAFLQGRPEWRESLWQCLKRRWDLTQADDNEQFAENLETLMDTEASLCTSKSEYDPVARAILTAVAFRHYGAHHFSRDRYLVVHHLGTLMGSATQTAIFYWNQATTDT